MEAIPRWVILKKVRVTLGMIQGIPSGNMPLVSGSGNISITPQVRTVDAIRNGTSIFQLLQPQLVLVTLVHEPKTLSLWLRWNRRKEPAGCEFSIRDYIWKATMFVVT